jgi:branched-chain amino acid transport system substrate-binding protein
MKKIWIGIGVIIVGFLIVFIYFINTDKDQKGIKIGIVAPLTGPISSYGENIRDGVLLAVNEINQNGGIKGNPIVTYFEDEGGGPQASVNAVLKLISINNVKVIIGPATSNGVMASAPIAEKNHVVLLSPSGTSDNIREAGDYIFRNRASVSQEAIVFTKYIIDDLGIKRFAILRADADYAKSFGDICGRTIQENGGSLIIEEIFSEGSSDFRTQLSKIKATTPQGLFIIGVPIELGNILKQIREIGLKTQIFSNTVDSPDIFKLAGGAEEGLTFVTTFYDPVNGDTRIVEFDKKFKERYGRGSHLFGANAYDAVYILKRVIEEYGYDGERIKDGLYQLKKFTGAAGLIEFDEKGDLKFTKVAIKKVTNGKFVFVKEVQ